MANPIYIIELCPSGRYAFVVAGYYSPEFQLWDTFRKKCVDIRNFEGTGRITAFKVISEGEAFIECRNMVMNWNIDKGIYNIKDRVYVNDMEWDEGGQKYYFASRISPDGNRKFNLIDGEKELQIIDVKNGNNIASVKHTDIIRLASFHPYGRLIVWAGNDNIIRLWNLETNKSLMEWKGDGDITACCVTKQERIIYGDSEGSVVFFDTPFIEGRIDRPPLPGLDPVKHFADDITSSIKYYKRNAGNLLKDKMNFLKESTEKYSNWWHNKD